MDDRRIRFAGEEAKRLKREYLTGADLARAIITGTSWLGENSNIVDELNVFPVPDGDTGRNMHLTLAAAVREIEAIDGGGIPKAGAVASAAAAGSLMGARGNSGVIFSQLLRGFAAAIENRDVLSAQDLGRALNEAARVAYKAVMKPVEGTMLTVAREAARAAAAALRSRPGPADVCEVMQAALQGARDALGKTPEMLPILKEAGVVDAGGKGVVLFIEGALAGAQGVHRPTTAPKGRVLTVAPPVSRDTASQAAAPRDVAVMAHPESLNYKYCTEFLLKGHALPLDAMRQDLAAYGDCLLVVGTPDVAKVHIHTNDPGVVLQYSTRLGDLSEIQINNMVLQAKGVQASGVAAPAALAKEFAVVAVASGEGLREILKSLGADEVVEGGQTMNPSIEDLVKAADRAPSDNVIILPNNSNVVLTAEQAKGISKKKLAVVPSKTIPQGVAALLAIRPDQGFEEIAGEMSEAISGVRTGEVTFAVRNSTVNGLSINEDDILGLADGDLKVVGKTREKVAIDLVREIAGPETELITIYYGENVTLEEARRLAERIQEDWPGSEVELQYGGQPLYYYVISAE